MNDGVVWIIRFGQDYVVKTFFKSILHVLASLGRACIDKNTLHAFLNYLCTQIHAQSTKMEKKSFFTREMSFMQFDDKMIFCFILPFLLHATPASAWWEQW